MWLDSLPYMLTYDAGEAVEVLLRVGCEYAGWDGAGDWIAVEVGDCAPCLGEDEGCGGIVPRGEEVFELEFATSHGEVAKLWSGGTEAAYVVALHEGVADDVGAYLGELLVIDGECGTHDAVLEWAVGNVDWLAVEECALAILGME